MTHVLLRTVVTLSVLLPLAEISTSAHKGACTVAHTDQCASRLAPASSASIQISWPTIVLSEMSNKV